MTPEAAAAAVLELAPMFQHPGGCHASHMGVGVTAGGVRILCACGWESEPGPREKLERALTRWRVAHFVLETAQLHREALHG